MRSIRRLGIFILLLLLFISPKNIYAQKNFKISKKQIEKKAKIFRNSVNKNTRHTLGINYYLEKIRKAGGGELRIKKGKYVISNSLYIPSNTKVILENGVTMKKNNKACKKYKPSKSIWQFVPKNRAVKTKKKVSGYNGTSNSSLEGEGNVTLNINKIKGECVVVAHCKNISVKNIKFTGMNGDHYIETNAANNVLIENCKFYKAKNANKYYAKEAINIDIATKHSLPLKWCKYDYTPCNNITINKCVLDSVNRGIGSHKYIQKNNSTNIYNTNINITNNTIKNIYDCGIYILNWKNTKIINNTFTNVGTRDGKGYKLTNAFGHGIGGGGVHGIEIRGNKFGTNKEAVYIEPKRKPESYGNASNIMSTITKNEVKTMLDNTIIKRGKGVKKDIYIYAGHKDKKKIKPVIIDLKKKTVEGMTIEIETTQKPTEQITSAIPTTQKVTEEVTTQQPTTEETTTEEVTTEEITTEQATSEEVTTGEETTTEEITTSESETTQEVTSEEATSISTPSDQSGISSASSSSFVKKFMNFIEQIGDGIASLVGSIF